MLKRVGFSATFLAVIILTCSQTALAQSKSETTEWINTKGQEILRNVTGNSSIQWQMDEYGRLKITNYKSKREGKSNIIKRYSYMNLYEMDSSGLLIGKSTNNENTPKLLLHCKPEKKACIKSRHYSTKTEFKTFANSSFTFPLEKEFDKNKGERLKKVLTHAIKLFQNDTSTE